MNMGLMFGEKGCGCIHYFKGRSKVKTRFDVFAAVTMLAIGFLVTPAWSQATAERGFLAGKKFDLNGPTPRTANGKPDLTGVWDRPAVQDITRPVNAEGMTFTPEPTLPFTEWGKLQWEAHYPKNDYAGACLPYGFPRAIVARHPIQLLQHNDFIGFLFEQNGWFTVVPIDGRAHPGDAADNPTWFSPTTLNSVICACVPGSRIAAG